MASSDRDRDKNNDSSSSHNNNGNSSDNGNSSSNTNLHKSVFNRRRFSAKTPELLVLWRAATNPVNTYHFVILTIGA